MKTKMRKLAVIGVIVATMFAMTGCGGGEDTKDTIIKTTQDVTKAIEEPMKEMGVGMMALMGVSDPSEIKTAMDPVIGKMDDAISAIDAVEAPGEDSQKIKDTLKESIQLMKDMFTDFSNMSDVSEAEGIQSKYEGQMADVQKKSEDLLKEIGEKYDVDLSQYMQNTSSAGATDETMTTDDTDLGEDSEDAETSEDLTEEDYTEEEEPVE